jgi:hypothetical protein
MFAIVSGLDHAAIRRLKSTWDKVPVKYSRLLTDMLTLMDPSMNFRRYRNLVTIYLIFVLGKIKFKTF